MTNYAVAHWVQFALDSTQVSGTQVASWISYTSWNNLNAQTLTSFGTTITNTISYTRGGDLAALDNTYASNIKGNTAVALGGGT